MSLINLFAAVGRGLADWRRRHRAYAELMALDDRSLADIGVRRSQIAGLVYGSPERSVDTAAVGEATIRASLGLHKAA